MLPWKRYIRQLSYQKVEVYVVNLLAAIFGDQRSRVLEKNVNETEESKTVFSHLNKTQLQNCTITTIANF